MCGIFLVIEILLLCYYKDVNEEGSEMRSNSFYQNVTKMATKLLDIGSIFQVYILPSSFRRMAFLCKYKIVPFC